MTKYKKRSFAALLAALLIMSVSAGLTAAYFSATDPYIGEAKLMLKGKTVIHEGDSDTKKDLQIENVGEVPVFVRAQLFGPDQLETDVDESIWIDGGDGYYYYYKILEPGEKTETGKLVGKVTMSEKEAAEMGDSFTVTSVQECSTIVYDDSDYAQPVLGWPLPDGVARQ